MSILRVTFLEQPANIILWIIVYLHIRFSSNQYLQGCPGIQGNTVTLSGAGYPCYFDLKKCSWKLFIFLFLIRKWKPFTFLISSLFLFSSSCAWCGQDPRSPGFQTNKHHCVTGITSLSLPDTQTYVQQSFSRNMTPWKEIVSTFRRLVWKQSVRKKRDAMIQSLSNNHYPMQQRSYLSDSTSSEN